jgi:hypothetical protein
VCVCAYTDFVPSVLNFLAQYRHVRGHFVRRLMITSKVAALVAAVRDTGKLVASLQGEPSLAVTDALFLQRAESQLTAAR